jgi:ketosteroid isomerase-like protein
MDAGFTNVSVRTVETGSSGRVAYEQGDFALDIRAKDGKTTHMTGKYIVVWKRSAKGQWQLYRDIWNETPQ